MANPFLVLGGIAVGIVTAGFGILQVPGWIASAQDAAAVNDVAQMTAAQAAAMSQSGTYLHSLTQLNETEGVQVNTSGGVSAFAAADESGKHSVSLTRSASGKFFARLGSRATVGEGATIGAAVTAAGTTVTGNRTAEGVWLPFGWDDGWVLPHNYVLDPFGTSLASFTSSSSSLSLRTDFPGKTTTAVRSTAQITAALRWMDFTPGLNTPFGQEIRFSALIRSSHATTLDFSLRREIAAAATQLVPDQSIAVPAGVTRVTVTFQAPASAATATSGITMRGTPAGIGATVDVTDISFTAPGKAPQ